MASAGAATRYGGVGGAGRWKREREPQSMERERERERDRVPPFNWTRRREIIFPKIPLVASDSFGATRLPR